MEQMCDLDGNVHECNTNINQFLPLFESDNEEGTKHRAKPKTLIIVLSGEEKEKEE